MTRVFLQESITKIAQQLKVPAPLLTSVGKLLQTTKTRFLQDRSRKKALTIFTTKKPAKQSQLFTSHQSYFTANTSDSEPIQKASSSQNPQSKTFSLQAPPNPITPTIPQTPRRKSSRQRIHTNRMAQYIATFHVNSQT